MAAELTIKIGGADTSSDAAQSAAGNVNALGAAAQSAGGFLGGMGNIVGGAVSVALGNVLTSAIGAATGALHDFVDQVFEAEKLSNALDFAIMKQGDSAVITSAQGHALAQSLKDLAGGSGEAVMGAEAVLLKFQNIGKETFPGALQASLDLAASMGIGVPQAAQFLGKVLEVPGSGLAKLKAAGVEVTEQFQKQIKAMEASGDTAGAQGLILEALSGTIGGKALSASKDFTSQLGILKEHFIDAGAGVLEKFLPPLETLLSGVLPPLEGLMSAASEIITDLLFKTDDAGAAFDGFSDQALGLGTALGIPKDVILGLLSPLGDLVTWFRDSLPGALDSTQTSMKPVTDAAKGLAQAFTDKLPVIKGTVEDVLGFVKKQFTDISPTLIGNVKDTLNQITTFWKNHGDQIMAVVDIAFKFISTTISGTLLIASGIIKTIMQVINGDWTGAWQTIKDTTETFINLALGIVGTNLTNFKKVWSDDWDMFVTILKTVWKNVVTAISQGILDAITAAKAIITGFGAIGQGIIDALVSGVTNAAAGLATAAVNAVLGAIAAAKNSIGWHSPPQMLIDMGLGMMQALSMGIGAGAANTANMMSNSTTTIVRSATYNNNLTMNALNPPSVPIEFGRTQAMSGVL